MIVRNNRNYLIETVENNINIACIAAIELFMSVWMRRIYLRSKSEIVGTNYYKCQMN